MRPSTVAEGDDVSLTCVLGCPARTAVVWFRDGQRVLKPVFQARREDAGRYYCAVLGQETVRSASVVLNVQCEYRINAQTQSTGLSPQQTWLLVSPYVTTV